MLGSALRRYGATDNDMPLTKSGKPLVGGYRHHPVTVWVGDTQENFEWAAEHGIALAEEYTFRYGKTHYCEAGIRQMADMSYLIPSDRMTPFAQAMPEKYRNGSSVVAYRDYYWNDKRKNIQCEWNKGRQAPEWWYNLKREEVLDELTKQAQELDMGY